MSNLRPGRHSDRLSCAYNLLDLKRQEKTTTADVTCMLYYAMYAAEYFLFSNFRLQLDTVIDSVVCIVFDLCPFIPIKKNSIDMTPS